MRKHPQRSLSSTASSSRKCVGFLLHIAIVIVCVSVGDKSYIYIYVCNELKHILLRPTHLAKKSIIIFTHMLKNPPTNDNQNPRANLCDQMPRHLGLN